MKITSKKILITGGATGIGFAMAQRFVANGNTVIVCGRRKEVLEEATKKIPGLITRQCDLAKPAERESLFEWIEEKHDDLQILVNNAGIQNWMQVGDKDFFDRAKSEITINIEAPLHLCSLFSQLKS